ncbi:MAG: amidohydrolase family protein [Chitinispirillia bacterium]|jgi:5-methylthioadenosine/S-adenosylhomocysteine deaminase
MAATVYYAKWILLPRGDILNNGAIVVTDDRITSIGTRSTIRRSIKDRTVNVGKRILLPGLINMHTHLEEAVLRGSIIQKGESFTSWMLKKDSYIKNSAQKDIISTIRLGIRESLANGITTIVDTSRTDHSIPVLHDEPVRSWVMHEINFTEKVSEKDLILVIKKRLNLNISGMNKGLSPYAVFSLDPKLHKCISRFAKEHSFLWALHMAESAEELQAFSEQKGDLYFQITRKRKWPFGKVRRGSAHYAITNDIIPPYGILYHCNYISSEELSFLASKNITIVLCCRYNELFGHKRFPLEIALNRKMNICLATETPISFDSINLFDELFYVKREYPYIPATQLIDWVTINPAKALGCQDILGTIENGKKADIIGVNISHNPKNDILEEMLEEEPEIDFVLVNGEEVIVR